MAVQQIEREAGSGFGKEMDPSAAREREREGKGGRGSRLGRGFWAKRPNRGKGERESFFLFIFFQTKFSNSFQNEN